MAVFDDSLFEIVNAANAKFVYLPDDIAGFRTDTGQI
jgi:hypothetical protein